MNTPALESFLLTTLFVLAPVVFGVLWFVDAPYGRHQRPGWGPGIDNRSGWVLMESPACLVFAWMLRDVEAAALAFVVPIVLWQSHYLHRAFVYPFSLRRRAMPLAVVLMGMAFNCANAYLNGSWLARHAGYYDLAWLLQPVTLVGCLLFCVGFAINRRSDAMLRALPRPGATGYAIPHGFLYRCVSCPNYLGELIEWTGWAIAVWSPPGLVFAVWTAANLVPRARAHHRWYREHFAGYPPERRALLPYLF